MAKFTKGSPKIGGRQKGTPNKDKMALRDMLAGRWPGYHPVKDMADLANDGNAPMEMRFNANKEVAKYIEPQLKAVDHAVAISGSMTIKWPLPKTELDV